MAVNNNSTLKTSTRVSSTSADGLQHDNNTMAVLEFTGVTNNESFVTREKPFAGLYPSNFNLGYEIPGDTNSDEVRSYPSWFELNQSYYTWESDRTPAEGFYGGDTISLPPGIYEFNVWAITQSRQYNGLSYSQHDMEAVAVQHWFTGVEDFASDLSDQGGWYDSNYLTLLHEEEIESEKVKQWHGKFTFSFTDKIGSKAHFRIRADKDGNIEEPSWSNQAFCRGNIMDGSLNMRNFTTNFNTMIPNNYAFRSYIEIKRVSGKPDAAWDYYYI